MIFGRDDDAKYTERDDLPVLEKKDVSGNYIKNTILPRLAGKDWQLQFESQNYLRSVYKHVPEIFSTGKEATFLTVAMIDNLTKSAENLRSQVRKNGLTTIGELFEEVPEANNISDGSLDALTQMLLKHCADKNKFVSDPAAKTFLTVCGYMDDQNRVVNLLHS